jgi:anti-anti-sigma regulatory factor
VSGFSLDVRPRGDGVTVVAPRGDLDEGTAPELAGWLDDLRIRCADVELDLSAVGRLDEAGRRVIDEAARNAARARTRLRVRDPAGVS